MHDPNPLSHFGFYPLFCPNLGQTKPFTHFSNNSFEREMGLRRSYWVSLEMEVVVGGDWWFRRWIWLMEVVVRILNGGVGWDYRLSQVARGGGERDAPTNMGTEWDCLSLSSLLFTLILLNILKIINLGTNCVSTLEMLKPNWVFLKIWLKFRGGGIGLGLEML